MATGPITQIADVIVPEIFNPYIQQLTEQKSAIIRSGAAVRDSAIDADLAGGGLTFNAPSFKDLDNDADNISSDEADDAYTGGTSNSTPKKTGTSQETIVRLSRNQSWSSADLATALAGVDPMTSIANRVSDYWARRLQAAFLATMGGIFANNDTATDANHVQGDMANDVSGASYSAGVTDFSSAAFIDAVLTMGDSMEQLSLVTVHSIVYARMQKNNLIDFIPDSNGVVNIPTYLGRRVVVDDGMTNSGTGVFQTWMFGAGAVRLGMGSPKVPTEMKRDPDAGNGGGQEVLYNRTEWAIHPTGNRWTGASANGGPSNAATANNLGSAASWQRVYPERKQIKIARLITREF